MLRWTFSQLAAESGELVLADPERVLGLHALATSVLVVPLGLVIGALALFPFVGPLYRIEKHLVRFFEGEDPGVCRLRKGDRLQSLNALVNRLLDQARAKRASGERSDETAASDRDLQDVPAALPAEPEYEQQPDYLV